MAQVADLVQQRHVATQRDADEDEDHDVEVIYTINFGKTAWRLIRSAWRPSRIQAK